MMTEKMLLPTTVDESEFRQYITQRDAPRSAMAHGVYPNCVACLARYAELETALNGELADVADYHAQITAQVQPYIAQLQLHMEAIAQIVETIETAAKGTFGIELPAEEQPE